MRILLAMDSFKGSLGAERVCDAIGSVLKESPFAIEVDSCPLSDGGEGCLALYVHHRPGGEWRTLEVNGPFFGQTLRTPIGWWPQSKTAVVEAAAICGLPLVNSSERNPLNTTTYGIGQVLKHLQSTEPCRIILTLGGTATMDAGLGAAMALGWQFFDQKGHLLKPNGQAVIDFASYRRPDKVCSLPLELWVDVATPLQGSAGAAPLYAKQKGATPDQVIALAAGYDRLGAMWRALRDLDLGNIPGSGAAGGLAAGMLAFCNASLVMGSQAMATLTQLEHRVQQADVVITGEGRFDATSLQGKIVSHVATLAQKYQRRLVVIAGQVAQSTKSIGAERSFSANPEGDTTVPPTKLALKRLKDAAMLAGNYLSGQ